MLRTAIPAKKDFDPNEIHNQLGKFDRKYPRILLGKNLYKYPKLN